MTVAEAPLCPAISHNRACNLEDFADPELRPLIQAILSEETERLGGAFPYGREDRRHWQAAMATRALDEFGALRDDGEVLAAGAGAEAAASWLGRRARVLSAPPQAGAIRLSREDESFDAIICCGPIELLTDHAEVRLTAAELCRLLKPGGVATISTELRIAGPPSQEPGRLIFDPGELRSLLADGLPWRPAAPFDPAVSPATLATAQSERTLLAPRSARVRYPLIALRRGEQIFTSAHIVLTRYA